MRAQILATLRMALPMMLGQGAQLLMHVIDGMMVGNLGVHELAACAMGNAAASLLFLVGVAIGSTVPALAARAFGAGDADRMNLVLRHGLAVSLVYSAGIAGFFAFASAWILPWFGPAELVGTARPYAILLMFSLIPALLVQNLRGFAEAQKHPWLPLGNITLGVVLNVVFNTGLIYGHYGLPALGLPGAALGTLLARICMLVHFVWLLRRRPAIAPRPGFWRPVGWRDGFYGEYLRLAAPMAAGGMMTDAVPGVYVTDVASPRSVSSTVHSAPTRRSSIVTEYPFAAVSCWVAAAPRSIAVHTPSRSYSHDTATSNGPAPKAAAPGPVRTLSMVSDPTA